MNVEHYSGYDAIQAAARAIAKRIAHTVATRGDAVIALPGGRSVVSLFRTLANAPLAWEHVSAFPADERCVPLDDERSNYRLIREELIGTGDHAAEQLELHPYRDNPADRGTAVARLNADFYATAPQRRFDVLLLGVGEDGHVASLFPGNAALASAERGYLFVPDAAKPPAERVTVSPELVRNARTTVLLLLGEGKREALESLLDTASTPERCPARLATEAEECLLFTDLRA